ncbi:MAG: uroporphyrinogen-III C-methyltransferase [Gemmatimonadaceae bacterium]
MKADDREAFGAGIVHIVGAGPGDAGLITARGRDLIERADAIVFDSSVNRALLPPGARESGHPDLYFVGRRRKESKRVSQRQVEELLVGLARSGKRVVRLTGGDPFVFGRGGDEAQALYDASVPFEVVPGITAGVAALSYAGIPVTHSGLGASVTFVSGREVPGRGATQTDWAALAKSGGTIVIYMGVKTVAAITEALLEGGMPGEIPAAAVERGTRKTQRTVTATLGDLAESVRISGLTGPAILVVGWPVILREEMSWFENRPLFGRRIVVADPESQSGVIAERLRDLGAEVLFVPERLVARLDLSPLREAVSRLDEYKWLVFATRDSVTIFWEQLLGSGRDSRALAGLSVVAVGADAAAALLEHGITVDVIPPGFTEESLIESLGERSDVDGSSVLFISPEGFDGLVADYFAGRGARLVTVDAYRSVANDAAVRRLRRALDRVAADAVVFLSTAAVRAYLAAAGEDSANQAPAASIGDRVTEALNAAGIEILCEASEPVSDALVAAIQRALA